MRRTEIGTIEPQKVERDVGRPPRASDEVVELRAAGLVGRYDLSAENSLGYLELGRHCLGERVKACQGVAAPLLEVEQGPKPVVFQFEEPVRVVEGLFPRARNDGLYSRQWHNRHAKTVILNAFY